MNNSYIIDLAGVADRTELHDRVEQGIPVPERGRYGTGMAFLPKDEEARTAILAKIRREVECENCTLSHVRDVPVNSGCIGEMAAKTEPHISQLFITSDTHIGEGELELECAVALRFRIPGERLALAVGQNGR